MALMICYKTWRAFFQANTKLSLEVSCKSELNSQFANTLKYKGLGTHVGDFRNNNHFIIFNFLLMNNISITIEMYVRCSM